MRCEESNNSNNCDEGGRNNEGKYVVAGRTTKHDKVGNIREGVGAAVVPFDIGFRPGKSFYLSTQTYLKSVRAHSVFLTYNSKLSVFSVAARFNFPPSIDQEANVR